jgi:ferredoxin-type protein NapG
MPPANESDEKAQLSVPLTRRSFLEMAGMVTFLVGVGGVVAFRRRPEPSLRPPGALPDAAFNALCVRCQRCEQICPTSVIRPVLVTEDLGSANTPRLSFGQGYCTFCGKCVAVCPTGALQSFAQDQVRVGIARIDKDRCIAWNWVACTKCHNECPVKAVALDSEQRPVVDPALCNGCGLCENVCIASIARSYRDVRGGKGIIVVPNDL